MFEGIYSGETVGVSLTLCPRHREGTVRNMAVGPEQGCEGAIGGPEGLISPFKDFRFHSKGIGKLKSF